MVIINRAQILNRYKRHIFYVSFKISRSLKFLSASCKSFCVHVPVWGDFKESNKISHFMKSNELKFWKTVVDITLHVSTKFQKDSRSYVSDVASQSCYDKSLHWEDIKQIFEVEQIQLGRAWRKEFEDWEAQIHYQDLHMKVWYVITYLIPYNILYEIHTYT